MSNLMNILDLVVVITFWGDLVLEVYATEKVKGIASSLRILRLFQIALTVFKLESVSPGFRRVARVFSSRSSELLVCVFLALALTMLGAILVYFVEGSLSSGNVINLETFPECKQMPHRFASLTRCIYWCAMTVTTVGYGDMHPCTSLGQLLASVWGFFGVAVVALPSGIIGSGLVDVMVRTVAALERALTIIITNGSTAAPSLSLYHLHISSHCLPLALLRLFLSAHSSLSSALIVQHHPGV